MTIVVRQRSDNNFSFFNISEKISGYIQYWFFAWQNIGKQEGVTTRSVKHIPTHAACNRHIMEHLKTDITVGRKCKTELLI